MQGQGGAWRLSFEEPLKGLKQGCDRSCEEDMENEMERGEHTQGEHLGEDLA